MLEPPPVPQTNPEEVIKGYPWPSSKLAKADMIRLTDLRDRLRKPITTLLHDAVAAYYHVLVNETGIVEEQRHNGQWRLQDVPTKELIAELQRRKRIAWEAE